MQTFDLIFRFCYYQLLFYYLVKMSLFYPKGEQTFQLSVSLSVNTRPFSGSVQCSDHCLHLDLNAIAEIWPCHLFMLHPSIYFQCNLSRHLSVEKFVTPTVHSPVYQVEVWSEVGALEVTEQPGEIFLKEHLECCKVLEHLQVKSTAE